MTIALWMIFIAGMMPYAIAAIAKSTRAYDNSDPRNPANFPTQLRRNAYDAHKNAFEAFPFFAIAVLLAMLRGASPSIVDGAAIAWLIARLVYVWMYLSGRALSRKIVWWLASLATITIYLAALTR